MNSYSIRLANAMATTQHEVSADGAIATIEIDSYTYNLSISNSTELDDDGLIDLE